MTDKPWIAPNGVPYPRVRLKEPGSKNPTRYYKQSGTKGRVWVTKGYDTWITEDWLAKYKNNKDYAALMIHYEFFGDPIDIWEGYSDE